jgi:hypothetical protein
MLMLACVDNIYAAHEGPVTLKKTPGTFVFVRVCQWGTLKMQIKDLMPRTVKRRGVGWHHVEQSEKLPTFFLLPQVSTELGEGQSPSYEGGGAQSGAKRRVSPFLTLFLCSMPRQHSIIDFNCHKCVPIHTACVCTSSEMLVGVLRPD